jgi:NAD(P)-dependent dehydrogenase (short-subunit alcohol dehydrogenase family)
MRDKVCLVTGGNSGIGKETAVGLAKAGARVVIVARDRRRGEEALADIRSVAGTTGGAVSLMLADLSSQSEVRRLASEFSNAHPRLDVLVNNAGAVFGERLLSADGVEMTFALNHLGYFLLTHELLNLLRASAPARIVNVASDAHRSAAPRLDDLQYSSDYGGFRVYSHSKLANVMFTYELARRIDGTGVTANALHPGVVATNFGNSGGALFRLGVRLVRPFFISSAKGARTSIYLAASPEVEGISGKYFVNERETRSSPASYDESAQRRLWEESERLTGVRW